MIDASEFYSIYDEVCEECTQRWSPEMQLEVAQHCYGWSLGLFDLKPYFRCSSVRFYAADQKLKEQFPSNSPSLFMENIKQFLKVDGLALFEVPNIAYWENRKKLLFGISQLVPIEQIFRSKTPFIGHHHEYAKDELLTLMRLSDFHVLDVETYNYSRVLPNGFLKTIKHINASSVSEVIFDITTALFPNTRECISVVVKK